MSNMYTYDNVTIVPRELSEIPSRDDCDTSVNMFGVKLDVPLIASPMPDVCGSDTAFVLKRSGAMGIIHRFQSIDEQVKEFCLANAVPETSSFHEKLPDIRNFVERTTVGCAIGVTGDYADRFAALYSKGCRIFCIDIANGFNTIIENSVKVVRNMPGTYVIAGNVATREGFEYLSNLGVDAVRVGMAGGSVCTTRYETGVYMPPLESVRECVNARRDFYIGDSSVSGMKYVYIIADGGIRHGGDMAKALAVGADAVMGGRVFAGYKEAPGPIVKDRHTNQLYKLYRGAASHGVQKEANGEIPDYNEGAEELVPYIDKSVASVVKRFKHGFRSTMSMTNAKTITGFRENVFVELL